MRQLFVAGLSTSSGLVDSLTWLLQIKQAGTRDAYDSTLKAPLNPPTAAIIPPPPPSPLFPPVSQASQGSSDRRKSASGLFQVSQIRDGGDFHFPYSVSFIPWALISFWLCTVTWFLLKNEWAGFACSCGTDVVCWYKRLLKRVSTNAFPVYMFIYYNICFCRYISMKWLKLSLLWLRTHTSYCLINVTCELWIDFIRWIQLACRPCWMLHWIKCFGYLNTGQYAFVF